MSRSAKRLQEAADWLTRLQRPEVDEAQWLAFDAWLSEPGAREAYDAVQAVDEEIFQQGDAVLRQLAEPRPAAAKEIFPIDWRWLGGLGAVATVAAVAITLAPWGEMLPQPDTLYTTAKGESRAQNLTDGTRIELNTNSHISVRLEKDARRVTIHEGQALFDVARDGARPFLITAGDETVRATDARLDVRRRDGQLSITVLRGQVEVATDGEDPLVRLRQGQMLEHVEGAGDMSVRPVVAEEQVGWRYGRLIYRDQPLGRVVADMNHYFERPIRLEGENTANLRFSGVLLVDRQDAMVRRLTSLLPLVAAPADGAIVLRGKPFNSK